MKALEPSPTLGGERIVRCPACAGPSVYALHNTWRPFCSAACRQSDLGAWASEAFRVNVHPSEGDDLSGQSKPQP